jgi:hypothetical protein
MGEGSRGGATSAVAAAAPFVGEAGAAGSVASGTTIRLPIFNVQKSPRFAAA